MSVANNGCEPKVDARRGKVNGSKNRVKER